MTKIRTIGTLALGVALVAGNTGVAAMSLGRLRGSALLGHPLDVTVPVQASTDDDLTQMCFEADVFFGDGRQEAGLVSTSLLPGGVTQAVQVRIRTTTRVDEPVVTVYLKSVCIEKTSKRYVLLSDMASEVTPVAAPVLPSVAAPTPPAVPVIKKAPEPERASVPQAQAPKVTDTAAASLVIAKKPSAKASKPASRSGSRARLTLSPIDEVSERDPVLRSSNELTTAPAEDGLKRTEALALWRALNASPQDILKEEARMQALEGDLKRLGDMTAKNRQSLQDVTSRLEHSEAQRYANPLVYALLLGLVACVAAIALLWQRLRKAQTGERPWWGGDDDDDDMDLESRLHQELDDEQGPMTEAMTSRTHEAVAAPSADRRPVLAPDTSMVDIDLEMGESVFAPPHIVAPEFKPSQPADFLPSAASALRAINSKEMLDVRQQAEFFMTLGQYEDAISLLEANVRGNAQASPLVYLDLLKVQHTLSRRQDFERYRAEFNQLFTGVVPPYASFHDSGRGLDAYPELSNKLVALWSSQEVVPFMEHCMARAPADPPDHGLDIEAFRELLMLHAVAQKLHAAEGNVAAPHVPAPSAVVPQPSAKLDFDLSDHEAPASNLIDFDISDYIKNGKPGST